MKSDWVYVDNLVLALVLASMGLLDDIPGRGKQPVAAGQPYFISDGNFHFQLNSNLLSFNIFIFILHFFILQHSTQL